jgi:hypothetical protein
MGQHSQRQNRGRLGAVLRNSQAKRGKLENGKGQAMQLINLTLAEMLYLTGDHSVGRCYGDSFEAVQVFGMSLDWRYWRLSDYVVSSCVSGPSVILVPRLDN